LIYRSLGPDLPAMAVDNALNRRKPYSGAFKLFSGMQALEHAEQLVDILHVEACAVVPHEDLYVIFRRVVAADLDFGARSHPGELDRIGDQVDNDQFQHGTVSIAPREGSDLPGDVAIARLLAEGKAYKDIAVLLSMGLSSVAMRVKTVYLKLGVHSRLELQRVMAAQLAASSSSTDEQDARAVGSGSL